MKTKQLILGGVLAFSLASNAQLPAGTTCQYQGQELITNGDFNSGNTGFTSGYTYVSGCASGGIHGDGSTINTYNVNAITTCYAGHTDRTGGNGNVIHFPDVQAASAGVVMWGQTVNVLPGKIYNLSLWAYEPTGNCPYQLPGTKFDIYINGALVQADNVGGCGSWNNKNYYWSSGTSITALIEIRTGIANFNSGFAGMDPLFDDISFKECLPLPPCEHLGGELITNGDFNMGNTGFSSGFTYVPSCWIPLNGGVPFFSTYNVDLLTPCYNITDHLGLNGNAMHFPDIQGTNVGQVFWQHPAVSVTPGNTYVLSLWVYEPLGNCPPQPQGTNFDIYINGSLVQADNVGGCGVWSLKYYSWNAGANTTALIEVRNATIGNYNDAHKWGMDLLLDDISFKECRDDNEDPKDPENPDGRSQATGFKNFKAPSQQNLSIMPNPSNGTTVLKSNADMEINVTNELGQVIRTIHLNNSNNHTEHLDNLSEGIYFINSSSGNHFVKQKLVIIK